MAELLNKKSWRKPKWRWHLTKNHTWVCIITHSRASRHAHLKNMSRLNNKKGSSLNFTDLNDDFNDEDVADDDSVSVVDPEELQKMLEVRILIRKFSKTFKVT